MDRLRASYQAMCREMPGGWNTMAAAMNITKDALENRIYERKGQSINVHEALQMQAFHGGTLFAEAVAAESGGVFFTLPGIDNLDNEEIKELYLQLVEEVGRLSQEWRTATKDGEVDKRERARLEYIQQAICTKVVQINQLTFKIFCR